MLGALRRAIGNLRGVHYGRPYTKFPTVPTGSSIRTWISCKRAMGASASVQRAAVPVARSITS